MLIYYDCTTSFVSATIKSAGIITSTELASLNFRSEVEFVEN